MEGFQAVHLIQIMGFQITFPQSNIYMNLNNIITKLNIALISTCGPHP
jgi:hypothetical protein